LQLKTREASFKSALKKTSVQGSLKMKTILDFKSFSTFLAIKQKMS
jgi:hypothetical protein